MQKNQIKWHRSWLVLPLIVMLLASCSTTKNVKYFEDIPDSVKFKTVNRIAFTDPVIQTDDILSIVIQTSDPQTSHIMNQGVAISNSASGASAAAISGYLVDKNGNVELPLIGLVKLAGLTTEQARDVIRTKTESLYKTPTVQVRFANFKVTVMGEVNRPSTYTMPNEKVTILDAIGLAGDLTIYGRRDNIEVGRTNAEGKQVIARLNLNSTDIFQNPYFYLKQNDWIYVEPNKAKIATTDAAKSRTTALITSAISLTVIIIARLIK